MNELKPAAPDTKSFFKEWLEKLQQESWQLELLISGLALFGIFEAKPWIAKFGYYVNSNIADGIISTVFNAFSFIISVGWWIFFINLLLHVILRSLWIGAIGLRYISSEIEYDDLNYSELFTNYLRKRVGNYDDFIERLEKICSVLFAYTFLLFLLFLSFTLFFIWIPVVGSIVDSFISLDENSISTFVVGILSFIYVSIGSIVFIDFLSVGWLKKTKDPVVSRIYLVIFRFYSTITLSFLYRPLLYNFVDHPYTRRLFYLSIPYMLAIFIGPLLVSNYPRPYYDSVSNMDRGELIRTCFYEDLKNKAILNSVGDKQYDWKHCSSAVTLSQFYIDKPFPSLFFRMQMSDKHLFEEADINPIYKEGVLYGGVFRDQYEVDSLLTERYDIIDKQLVVLRKDGRLLRDSFNFHNKSESDSLTVNYWKQEYLKNKSIRDSLNENKSLVKDDFEKEKSFQILNTLKGLHQVSIDGQNYNDALECHYYIHPVSEVKGILCHFDIAILSRGHHVLIIERKVYDENKDEGFEIDKFNLPFIKTF